MAEVPKVRAWKNKIKKSANKRKNMGRQPMRLVRLQAQQPGNGTSDEPGISHGHGRDPEGAQSQGRPQGLAGLHFLCTGNPALPPTGHHVEAQQEASRWKPLQEPGFLPACVRGGEGSTRSSGGCGLEEGNGVSSCKGLMGVCKILAQRKQNHISSKGN